MDAGRWLVSYHLWKDLIQKVPVAAMQPCNTDLLKNGLMDLQFIVDVWFIHVLPQNSSGNDAMSDRGMLLAICSVGEV